MISAHGHQHDLPERLMECSCGRGMLRWDGAGAWRCSRRWNAGTPQKPVWTSCQYGITLASLFDDIDLEIKLTMGIHITSLPLTSFALSLVMRGVVYLSWLTPAEAQYQRFYGSAPGHEEEESRERELGQLRYFMTRRLRKGE